MKEVLLKNSYPQKLIESKIRFFLSDDQKPPRPDRVHILNLDFTAFSLEPVVPFEKFSNVCYEFTCPCGSNYVGHSDRKVIKRIEEHQRKSKAKELYWHIQSCPEYIKKQNAWTPEKTNGKRF